MSKVKVRIAVAVSQDGMWNSCGFSKTGGARVEDKELMEFAVEPLNDGEARYFVEAELEIPDNNTIQAVVF